MRTKSFLAVAIVGLASAALAGCGGSSSPQTAAAKSAAVPAPQRTVTQQSHPTPVESNPDIGKGNAQLKGSAGHGADRGGDRVGPIHGQKAHATPATTSDDQNSTNVTAPNPCRLVSLSDAQSIAGGGITARIEAPLGPTCIYKARGKQAGVTLAVQSTSFSQATEQLRKRKTVLVSGRHGYCGRLGTQVLLVPLGSRQVLNVSAPCGLAQQFAARALRHLGA